MHWIQGPSAHPAPCPSLNVLTAVRAPASIRGGISRGAYYTVWSISGRASDITLTRLGRANMAGVREAGVRGTPVTSHTRCLILRDSFSPGFKLRPYFNSKLRLPNAGAIFKSKFCFFFQPFQSERNRMLMTNTSVNRCYSWQKKNDFFSFKLLYVDRNLLTSGHFRNELQLRSVLSFAI